MAKKDYYARNRERLKARARERYQADREANAARVRERYKTDPEARARQREASKRYYRTHRAEILERAAARRELIQEAIAFYESHRKEEEQNAEC